MNKHGYPVEFENGLPNCNMRGMPTTDDCRARFTCKIPGPNKLGFICGPCMIKMLHKCDHENLDAAGSDKAIIVACHDCAHLLTLEEVIERLNHE